MKTIFTKTLSAEQHQEIVDLYVLFKDVSLEQFPGFAKAAEPDVSTYYFLAYRADTLCGYACVKVKRWVMASVLFGPVVRDRCDYMTMCQALTARCRSYGVLVVRITLPYMGQQQTHSLMPATASGIIDSEDELHWNTLKLDLSISEDDIWQNFSAHHKRNIIKAKRIQLSTKFINDESSIAEFARQFARMYRDRGLSISETSTQTGFMGLLDFFNRTGMGYFMAVNTVDGHTIGGICVLYQGESAFYYKGYASPDHRQLPVSHLAFEHAILKAKNDGFKYFDFGGYAPGIPTCDQLYSINKFKKGFNGEMISHPRTMICYTRPGVSFLYKMAKRWPNLSLAKIK